MITVVLPALNEEKNIEATVDTVIFASRQAKTTIEIIIVNDGSTDNTSTVIEKLKSKHDFIKSIEFAENKGLGEGFKAAVAIAKYDKLSTFPGDNCCRPEIMYKLFTSADKADFLLTYLVNTENRPWSRRILSTIYSHIYGLIFDLPFKYMNGSPIYPTARIRNMKLFAKRYGIFAEINVKLARTGGTFAEIPDYVKANPSQSSALRFKNLKECLGTFTNLVFEVFIINRKKYAKICKRIIIENEIPWKQEGQSSSSTQTTTRTFESLIT